jgi:hypothetical protein
MTMIAFNGFCSGQARPGRRRVPDRQEEMTTSDIGRYYALSGFYEWF